MNCQIWLTLTLSDPLFLILMTPHLALDLKIGPPVRLLELLLAEKFCALTGPRLEPFKKLGIRMVGFLLCYIKHNDQALFRTYEKGHSFSVIFYQPFCISTGHLCHSPIEKQLPYPTYLKGVGSTFAMWLKDWFTENRCICISIKKTAGSSCCIPTVAFAHHPFEEAVAKLCVCIYTNICDCSTRPLGTANGICYFFLNHGDIDSFQHIDHLVVWFAELECSL